MDVSVGDSIPPWEMPAVRADRMRTMAAILRDPNPVHWDRSWVAGRGWGERTVNQGPLSVSYMMNMLMSWAGPRSIRRMKITFLGAVLDGDHMIATGTVTAVEATPDGTTLATCDVKLDHADGRPALAAVATIAVST